MINTLTHLDTAILMINMVNVGKISVEGNFSESEFEWKGRRGKKSIKSASANTRRGRASWTRRPPNRSASAVELCDCLMSSCVESEGPWREALGTTGRLSECRVIRNPSFSLRCVNGPAASIWTSPEEGSPPPGWNWIAHRGGQLWEFRGWKKEKLCVPIYRLGCRDH